MTPNLKIVASAVTFALATPAVAAQAQPTEPSTEAQPSTPATTTGTETAPTTEPATTAPAPTGTDSQGTASAPAATDQAAATRTAAVAKATAADLKAGTSVYDETGQLVGKVVSATADSAVVNTGEVRAEIPLSGFGKNDKGLVISATKADLDAQAKKEKPKATKPKR